MDWIKHLIDVVLHLDVHLARLVSEYGVWTYSILFLIVFCETGLVVTPLLPGDSLLFAAGALSALPDSALNVHWASLLIAAASMLGDSVNYWVGYFVGPKVFSKESSRLLNKKYLERTHQFYERHGGKTIIIARFMPIIRTFAPFVAGIGRMTYLRFLAYSISGSILWAGLFVYAGYFFGNIPFVKKNFTVVVLAIIFITVLPGIIEFLRAHFGRKAEARVES
ncbi:MAG TPA: DedA family protein [Blastocatellia bacterium]|nr:DedA family protein [Blastocatellia bacterium]